MPERSLADILGPWRDPDWESGLIARVREAWSKPIDRLTNHELATCLRQEFALGHLLPIARKRIADKFDDGTEVHDTELADAIGTATVAAGEPAGGVGERPEKRGGTR